MGSFVSKKFGAEGANSVEMLAYLVKWGFSEEEIDKLSELGASTGSQFMKLNYTRTCESLTETRAKLLFDRLGREISPPESTVVSPRNEPLTPVI